MNPEKQGKCEECGSVFDYKIIIHREGARSAGRKEIRRNQRFCKRECWKKGYTHRTGKHLNGKKAKIIITAKCARLECGRNFEVTKRQHEKSWKPKIFCSKNCQASVYRNNNIELIDPTKRGVAKKCREQMQPTNSKLGRFTNHRPIDGMKFSKFIRSVNPSRVLSDRIRVRIREALVKACVKPNKPFTKNTKELLGCSPDHLVKHIESMFTEGMNWDVFLSTGHRGIHIDHIKPCAAFDLTNEEEQLECFNWSNLQPLWAKDNQSKGAKIAA
jgi:hypothetical protein